MSIWFILRVLVGCIFLVSGIEKLVYPYQNFQYVIENYEIINSNLVEIIARTLPWIEVIIGLFVLLGLWLKRSLLGAAILFAAFIIVVAQAIVRGLPITECGCFGEMISFPIKAVLTMDICLFTFTVLLLRKIKGARIYSLDNLLDEEVK